MSEEKIKLVLDTNTIISGLLWKGIEFELLQTIEQQKALLFLNADILMEIHRILHYERLKKYIILSELSPEQLIEKITALAHIISGNTPKTSLCRDKEDEKFITCAILSNAKYIITGDEDLLVIKQYKNIKIITTKEALELIM